MILLVSFTLFKIVSDIFIYWENKPIAHIQFLHIYLCFSGCDSILSGSPDRDYTYEG